jgi:hypothetical protein
MELAERYSSLTWEYSLFCLARFFETGRSLPPLFSGVFLLRGDGFILSLKAQHKPQ